jgi:tetratricopeptide (TPR) repeat protein
MSIVLETEKLKEELQNTVNVEQRGELLLKIIRNYELLRSAEGEEFVTELLEMAHTTGNRIFEARARCFNGRRLGQKAEHLEAIDEFNTALELFTAISDTKGQIDCYNGIGTTFLSQQRLTEALSYYLKSLKLAEKSNDEKSRLLISINIGLIHYEQGNRSRRLTTPIRI